jgi:hypothetical protein
METAPTQPNSRLIRVLLACGVLWCIGCGKPVSSSSLAAKIEIAPQPVHTGSVTVTVKLADSAGQPAIGGKISLEGDMSHPGMEPVFSDAMETRPGEYSGHLDFKMPGDWVVLLHAALPDGRKLEKQVDVRGVQPQ